MAVREMQTEPAIIERIRRRRRPAKQALPDREALSVIRGVVRRSGTVENAIAAVKAINSAWIDVSPTTSEAIDLLLTILELSDNVEEALGIFSRLLVHYPSARTVLELAQEQIKDWYPGAELRLECGDVDVRLGMSFLYVLVPAENYDAFKKIHDRLGDWWLKTFPEVARTGIIDIFPQRQTTHV